MLSKNELKRIVSLQQSKFRNEQQRFLVEGPKIVEEILQSDYSVVGVYATADWLTSDIARYARKKEILVEEISTATLERISRLKTPNKVIAEVKIPQENAQIDLSKPIVALDGINDPGNLGTIIRSADWFGFQQVVCSKNSVELYNAKVLQATMGSFLRVKVFYTDLPEWLATLPNTTPVFGALMQGENLYSTEFGKAPVILIGNESKGISPTLFPLITHRITIPRVGGAESLNASIAAALFLSEFARGKRI